MARNRLIAIGTVLTFVVVSKSLQSFGPFEPEPKRIPVDDIGRNVTLVGRLGQPLGTMMDVKGSWARPGPEVRAKDDALRFIVTHVNSKRLDEPLELDIGQVRAVSRNGKNAIPEYDDQDSLVGATWKLRAFESGRFARIPKGYWDALGGVIPAMKDPGTFATQLVGVVQP